MGFKLMGVINFGFKLITVINFGFKLIAVIDFGFELIPRGDDAKPSIGAAGFAG